MPRCCSRSWRRGEKPDLAAALGTLRSDARELLGRLNTVLAKGQAGPPDLAAARDTLVPLLERVRSTTAGLRKQAADANAAALVPDLDRIAAATERLDALLGPGDASAATKPSDQAAGAGAAAAIEPAPPRSVILVVDDNEENRDMLARRLRRQGYEVVTATGGHAALDELARRPVDLVLLDVMMPDSTATRCCSGSRAIRRCATSPCS